MLTSCYDDDTQVVKPLQHNSLKVVTNPESILSYLEATFMETMETKTKPMMPL